MAYQPDPQTYQPPYQQSYPPYQQPKPAKGGISRRSVVIGLVSLVIGGSLISQVFSRHHDSHSFQDGQNGYQNANYGPGGDNNFCLLAFPPVCCLVSRGRRMASLSLLVLAVAQFRF